MTSSQSHSTKLLIAELKQSGDFQPRAVSIQVAASVATVEPPDGEVPQAQPAEGFRDDPENAMRRTGEVIFRRADQDRDGFLTADEMSKFPLPSQQSPERFAEFDADDDQRISLEEFVNASAEPPWPLPERRQAGRNRPE